MGVIPASGLLSAAEPSGLHLVARHDGTHAACCCLPGLLAAMALSAGECLGRAAWAGCMHGSPLPVHSTLLVSVYQYTLRQLIFVSLNSVCMFVQERYTCVYLPPWKVNPLHR